MPDLCNCGIEATEIMWFIDLRRRANHRGPGRKARRRCPALPGEASTRGNPNGARSAVALAATHIDRDGSYEQAITIHRRRTRGSKPIRNRDSLVGRRPALSRFHAGAAWHYYAWQDTGSGSRAGRRNGRRLDLWIASVLPSGAGATASYERAMSDCQADEIFPDARLYRPMYISVHENRQETETALEGKCEDEASRTFHG
jgi:hypothetical protein